MKQAFLKGFLLVKYRKLADTSFKLISHIFVVQLRKNKKCSSVIRGIVDNPINRQRRCNVYKTSKQRRQC